MPNHILRNCHIMVYLPIMDLKLQPHKIRQYGSGAGHCLDGRDLLAGGGADDWESVRYQASQRRFRAGKKGANLAENE